MWSHTIQGTGSGKSAPELLAAEKLHQSGWGEGTTDFGRILAMQRP